MGKFKTGHKKLGGRALGAPNKRTIILKEALENLGCDVTERLVKLLPKLKPDKQVSVLLELMNFIYPRRKAVELTGNEGGPIELTALSQEERQKRIKDLMEKRELIGSTTD